MDDVHGGSAGHGVGQHFLQGIERARFHRTGTAQVYVNGRLAFSRQTEDAEDLGARGVEHVGDAHTDAERALLQTAAQQLQHFLLLRGGGGPRAFILRQKRAAIVEHGHARRQMAGGRAVVDQRAAFALRVPGTHR